MAFTQVEESRLRALMNQDTSLLTLATNEPAIIQELGAQDVTIDELQLASQLLQTDKLLGRFGGEDKAVALSVLRAFMNNGMAALSDMQALFPKRVFSDNDFIRIPDTPGGLIIQWGMVVSGVNGDAEWRYPITFTNKRIGVFGFFWRSGTQSQDYPTVSFNNVADPQPLIYSNVMMRINGVGGSGYTSFMLGIGN